MKHIIYGLFDPNTHELRYIGYTSDMIGRYNKHHTDLRCKCHKTNPHSEATKLKMSDAIKKTLERKREISHD